MKKSYKDQSHRKHQQKKVARTLDEKKLQTSKEKQHQQHKDKSECDSPSSIQDKLRSIIFE